MFISFALLNVIVTVLILFFVTLLMSAIAKFNLARGTPETKKLLETKENLAPFKAICTLAKGAGFMLSLLRNSIFHVGAGYAWCWQSSELFSLGT